MTRKYTSMTRLETNGQAYARVRANGHRKPLRTAQEMADEFGVTWQKLAKLIEHNDGPKAELLTGAGSQRATWYKPGELRLWWASLPPEKKAKSK